MTWKNHITSLIIILFFSTAAYAAVAKKAPPNDSGKVTPPIAPVINYSSHEVPNEPIYNQQHELVLSICPTTPVCPNINAPATNRNDPNCPSQCRVKRIVDPDYGPGSDPQFDYVNSVTNAVCPPGYAQVAVFNMQREIINGPRRVIFPVPYAKLNDYKNVLNYACYLKFETPRKTNQYCGDKNNNNYQPQLKTDMDFGGDAGQYTITFGSPLCYLWNAVQKCDITANCGDFTGIFRIWTGVYQRYECSPRSTLYYGDNMAPASIVCARVRPMWQQIPPPKK